jgi:hypothetical protein
VAEKQQHQYQLPVEAIEYYIDRPVEFIEDQLGAKPDKYQRQALATIVDGDWPVLFAGHGVGKTALLSWIVIWWISTRPTCKIPVTSTKKEQLGDNLWPEIEKWRMTSHVAPDLVWQKTSVFLKGREATNFAVARTASTQEALQGFHDDHLLFIIEEASGVPDEIFEPALGALTNEGAIMVMVGNPTRSSGFFHKAFTEPTGRFKPIHIPCVDEKTGELHPRISPDFPQSIIDIYGKNSNQYRVRVLGLPPIQEDDVVIPWEWVNDAIENGEVDFDPKNSRIVWGLDVARFGDDETALVKRCGKKVYQDPMVWKGLDTMQTVGVVMSEWRDTPDSLRPDVIYVDVIGVGAGVVDRLREQGLPVNGVAVSRVPSSKQKYQRLRDELWWRGREWFETRNVSIPKGEAGKKLCAQLTTPRYTAPSDGKIHVEAKSDYKKRLPRIGSPDVADAFLLTLMDRNDAFNPTRESNVSRWMSEQTSVGWMGA